VRLSKTFRVVPPRRVGERVPSSLGAPNRYVWSALARSGAGAVDARRAGPDDPLGLLPADDPGTAYRVLVFDQFEEI
jgi:hypothetical protein